MTNDNDIDIEDATAPERMHSTAVQMLIEAIGVVADHRAGYLILRVCDLEGKTMLSVCSGSAELSSKRIGSKSLREMLEAVEANERLRFAGLS